MTQLNPNNEKTPYTLQYFKDADQRFRKWHEPLDNLGFFDDYEKKYQSIKHTFNNWLSWDNLIHNNSNLVQPNAPNIYHLVLPIDEILAKHFPIIGHGTTTLVFDIGTCVLKRVIPDNRCWESELFRLAKRIPSLYSERIEIHTKEKNYCDLYVQEKLKPINATHYIELIKKTYPSLNTNDCVFWEWGLDQNIIPHVYDWG